MLPESASYASNSILWNDILRKIISPLGHPLDQPIHEGILPAELKQIRLDKAGFWIETVRGPSWCCVVGS
jgi:hypothetical protein